MPLAAAGLALERAEVGNTTKVVKEVFGILDAGSAGRDIDLRDSVYHNEAIRTEIESATTLTFRDNKLISLGPSADITLDEFV